MNDQNMTLIHPGGHTPNKHRSLKIQKVENGFSIIGKFRESYNYTDPDTNETRFRTVDRTFIFYTLEEVSDFNTQYFGASSKDLEK